MRRLLNQYSFVVFAVLALVIVWVGLPLRGWPRATALAATAVAAVVGQRALRTTGGGVVTQDDLDRLGERGEPVLIEFYSDL